MDLATQQIAYDMRAVKVWMGKLESIEHHAFSLRLEARQNAANANKRTATDFMRSHLTFLPLQKLDQVLRGSLLPRRHWKIKQASAPHRS